MDEADDLSERTMLIESTLQLARVQPIRFAHYLVYTQDDHVKRVRIGAPGVTVGRQVGCDIVQNSPAISRQHCRFDLELEGATVSDLGSTNGTLVGGKRIDKRTKLRNGVQIVAGTLSLRYEQRDEKAVEDEARLEGELRNAVEYVRAILPEPITTGPVQAEWWYVPSSELGGDAFGYQYLNPTTFIGFVIDVSGHGLEPAMHAITVANAIRRRTLPGVDFADPAQVAAGVNSVFPMEEYHGLMLTMWYFAYDIPTRVLRYCSAGHHPSFLVTPEADAPLPLWVKAPSIGMLPHAKWQTGRAAVPPGSRLYVFSDGAFEIVATNGESWVLQNLKDVMQKGATEGTSEARRIYQAVRAAARPGPLDDDFSALVIHFGGGRVALEVPRLPALDV